MPRFDIVLAVTAVQAQEPTRVVHDGGMLIINKGDWLVEGDRFGLEVFTNKQFRKMFKRLGTSPEHDTRLLKALKEGRI